MTTTNATAEPAADAPTENAPAKDPEQQWLDTVYRKGEKQLTPRAIIAGMLIGGVMCLSNLYVFFKTGWSLGVTLTACILAFAVFELFRAVKLTKSEFTILENNAMGSVASAAGYMTGGGNMAAFGALLMVTTTRPSALWMMLWFGVIAAMGVFAAIPIKRQLINKEGLAFPTGKATAETLVSLHEAAHAEKDGAKAGGGREKAKLLGIAGLMGVVLAFLRDAKAAWMPFNLPGAISLPFTIAGRAAKDWTIMLNCELVLVGAGALMSFRTAWSLLLAAMGGYVVLAPKLAAAHAIKEVTLKGIVAWTLWPGAAILVASGMTSFLLDYKSIARSFRGLSGLFKGAKSAKVEEEPIAAVECPAWWFPAGFAVLGPIVIVLMMFLFQVPLWAGIVAVPLAVVMGFVAARVTGETDVTPTKALGPVTQAVYGMLTPGNLTGNIMSGNVTGGVGLHAADLLTDLKSGWLLGASPRQQLKGQLFGVVAGALVVVPAFWLIMPDPSVLGSEEWPAPSCLVWAGVSKAFAGGLGGLPPGADRGMLIGLALGVALALAERFAPKKLLPFVPSPAGIGIALVIPASNAIAMFIGATIAHVLRKTRPALAERWVIPVSSGWIAGESLMGIAIKLLTVMGIFGK